MHNKNHSPEDRAMQKDFLCRRYFGLFKGARRPGPANPSTGTETFGAPESVTSV